MPRCRNCDSHVTEQFARVFGDNEDSVHYCIDCTTNAHLHNGGGSSATSERSGVSQTAWDR